MTWQEVLVAVGATVSGLAAVWKARKGWMMLAETTIVVRRIYEEFRPNSGDSLRDRFDRFSETLKNLQAKVSALTEQVHDLRGRVARLEVDQ